MPTLDIISINIWQTLASLLNLLILFLLIKKFLYTPVKNVLNARQAAINGQYNDAEEAKRKALSDRAAYEEKLSNAKAEADNVIQSAVDIAHARENEIIADAKSKADIIVRQAKEEAALEISKAEDGIKKEIAEVSALIAEKVLEREINTDDHKQMIDSFISKIGEENADNK